MPHKGWKGDMWLFVVSVAKQRINILGSHSFQFLIELAIEAAIIRLYALLRLPPDLAQIVSSRGSQALLLLRCLHIARISQGGLSAIGSVSA